MDDSIAAIAAALRATDSVRSGEWPEGMYLKEAA